MAMAMQQNLHELNQNEFQYHLGMEVDPPEESESLASMPIQEQINTFQQPKQERAEQIVEQALLRFKQSPHKVAMQSPATNKSSASKSSQNKKPLARIDEHNAFYDKSDLNNAIRSELMNLHCLALFPFYHGPEYSDDG